MTTPQEPAREFPESPAGDQPAHEFVAQYEQSYARLATLAAAVLGRREGAEDIVQQAIEIALSKGSRFESANRFIQWMAAAVRRCALNQRRKTARRRTHSADPAELVALTPEAPEQPLPIDPDTGEICGEQTCFEDRLQQALNRLGRDARCCLLLRTVQELSYDEIAELLDIPAGTAMSHVHRSRKLLREQLAELPSDSPQSTGRRR